MEGVWPLALPSLGAEFGLFGSPESLGSLRHLLNRLSHFPPTSHITFFLSSLQITLQVSLYTILDFAHEENSPRFPPSKVSSGFLFRSRLYRVQALKVLGEKQQSLILLSRGKENTFSMQHVHTQSQAPYC